jgi:DNA-binding transcriptional regulator YbjK
VSDTDSRGHRNPARRRAILEATIRIVGEHGPRAVTHRAVAREADVPLAATTYYFSSREELLEEALRYAGSRDVRDLEHLAQSLSPGDLSVEALAAVLSAYLSKQLRTRRRTILAQYELQLESARRPHLRTTTRQDMASFLVVVDGDASGGRAHRVGSPRRRIGVRLASSS